MSDERRANTTNDARAPRSGSSVDCSPDQIAEAIKQRRIAAEKAHYDRGIPVAGHDNPAREAEAAAKREVEKYLRIANAKADTIFLQETARITRQR